MIKKKKTNLNLLPQQTTGHHPVLLVTHKDASHLDRDQVRQAFPFFPEGNIFYIEGYRGDERMRYGNHTLPYNLDTEKALLEIIQLIDMRLDNSPMEF